MENWLISGLTIMIWGLSLIVLWRTLVEKSITRIVIAGAVIILVSALIWWASTVFLGLNTKNGTALFFIGTSVFSLGVITVIQALGKGQEKRIRNWSFAVTGFGFAIVIVAPIIGCILTKL